MTQVERITKLEANYEHIREDLKEIKDSIMILNKNVNGLRLFRAKVIGYAAAIASIVSFLVALGFRFW